MQLFYDSDFDENTRLIKVSPEESRHISKVLRKQVGDYVYITNGKGVLASGTLKSNHPKKCEIEVEKIQVTLSNPSHLHIAIAPTKANDRFEWFLEKATEIGIQEITPLLCEHSERKKIKWERYQKVLLSAMKQSLKTHLPKLNQLTSFKDFTSSEIKSSKLIAHCEDTPKEKLSQLVKQSNTILIGPEGDFSRDEIKRANDKGFKAISLSESRLRTETAGLVACHTVNLIHTL
ncbi:16S rRNA (uracil(1498)-N(3))-methyltransferase [Psychroflexus tropicus]|uniref:16S rRNA (uracil(1498)-N(3))-methyltransferase n=1 Tax=Psychroflexus tropicus TaxID=197345 RepID=UPI00036D9638|nr:16S rRNA (uracil(1498)-N(3))-methyltransferase [Psychroflexus tropicus]